ncbi:ATPase AAA [Bifidobacterium dolichotidis]|uniref:ATPase AAA n=1 Tax=Bifidobacterium dolichotidis TaxID=2306976 RepID=A0A430FPJ0_9BIFI|nr:proteasome ATPase [Bifidobacterium dolichotidis]RSX54749.1 ATPase AAA [Bifidobacterium dolichotidis]
MAEAQQAQQAVTEQQLAEQNDALQQRNHALAQALTRATQELSKAKAQMEVFAQAPLTYATMVRLISDVTDRNGVQHATAEVIFGGRTMIVAVAPHVQASRLRMGSTVVLNETMVIVDQRTAPVHGVVRTVMQVLDDGRLLVHDGSGSLLVVERAGELIRRTIRTEDRVMLDASQRFALELVPHEDDASLVLEEIPDVSFSDIGGLAEQITRVRDAVELPFLHRELFDAVHLQAPKGVLLYGPPGNGKTMIAKAVARALSTQADRPGVFLSVKGPELLNKYVGESERMIRMIFDRARERAAAGNAVVVFIDEMDSLLRTRGSGVSSDVETTIVPQFLTELDGMEALDNVLVIGASNRIDMIDPAVLRPGRLDVKIRIDRPQQDAACAIVRQYLTDDLPLDENTTAEQLAALLVEQVYATDAHRLLARYIDERGMWIPLYMADVTSGASLKNIVDRAKTKAVKQAIATQTDARITSDMLLEAVNDECHDLARTLADVDAEQWARTNGIGVGTVSRIRMVQEAQQ